MTFRRRAVLVATLAVVVYNLPNFVFPFFEDTALFAAIGRYVLHGLVPYRELLDQKPPAMFLVTALTSAALGDSSVASRAVEIVFVVAAALGVGALVREIDERAEPAGTLIAGVLFSSLALGLPERGQVEIYQAMWIAWGGALVARHLNRPSLRLALGAGALVGVGCWFKPQAAVFGLAAAGLVGAWRASGRQWRDLIRDEAALAAGAALVSLPFLLYLAADGALHDFLNVMFVFNRVYLTKGSSPSWQVGLTDLIPVTPYDRAVAVLMAIAIAGLAFRIRRTRTSAWPAGLLGLWVAAGVLQYYSGRYFFRYHRIVLIGPEAALAALGLTIVLADGGRLARRHLSADMVRFCQVAVCAGLIVVAGLSPAYTSAWRSLLHVVSGRESLAAVYARTGREAGYFDYTAERALADYVRDRTAPGDAVQVLGRAGVFYLYVDRRPGSSYLVSSPAFDRHRPDVAAHQARFLGELRRTRPAYLIIRTRDRFPWFGLADSLTLLRANPAVDAYVESHYTVEAQLFEDFIVLRRRSLGP
jgi:hypothetical protein